LHKAEAFTACFEESAGHLYRDGFHEIYSALMSEPDGGGAFALTGGSKSPDLLPRLRRWPVKKKSLSFSGKALVAGAEARDLAMTFLRMR